MSAKQAKAVAFVVFLLAATNAARGAAQQAPTQREARSAVLLITSSELQPHWHRFADWKTSIGKPTKIVTVNQAASSYPAANIQESLRLCVRDHIDNHRTKWIILGGDCLADGTGVVPAGHTTTHEIEPGGIPTDIVYISKTNWDADGDGRCGEWSDDRSAISYPDGSVGLGRIPVRTAEDVAAFTEKVIQYESNYPTDKFARQMVYACTVPMAYAKVERSWDDYVSKAWDGEAQRYFLNKTPWDRPGKPGSHKLTADNMVELINSKTIGKLHIHGHGFAPAWVFDESAFQGSHVDQLKNTGAYPLVTTVSCFTGQFDAPQDPCIVEKMIRQPKAGSVAIVAPIRTGKPHFANPSDLRLMVLEGKLDGTTLTMTRYWHYGLKNNATTGEAMMLAKAEMADDATNSPNYHLCVCELNLLGDPTLCMRSEIPRAPLVKLPATIALNTRTLKIQTGAPLCTICVQQGDHLYQIEKADAQGQATFQLESLGTGKVQVTISGANLNTVTSEIECSEAAQDG